MVQHGWTYIDDHGGCQGPFTKAQMQQWVGLGHFRMSTLVFHPAVCPAGSYLPLTVLMQFEWRPEQSDKGELGKQKESKRNSVVVFRGWKLS